MNTFISLAITSSLTMLINPYVFAQTPAQGAGVVTLGGVVVDSACGLELTSADQSIEMDPEPIGRLLRNTEGAPHPFQLRLVNCTLTRPDPSRPGATLPDWEHLRVMFDGPRDREGRSFAALGDSQGVAFHIWDSTGEESIPGEPMAPHPLAEGDMTLNYILRLVGNGLPLGAGAHRVAVRFTLEYF
ncbi:fimbrial protein [Pseudomonas antarctica]|uniref:fimbrial protein n=1 Tax=Pseudomonas antarctica TaxID=219572 RepID=UPI00387B1500